jgi:ATP-binding cassette, subfamily C, bacterial CydD
VRPVDPRLLREAPAARRFLVVAAVLAVVGAVAMVVQAVALGVAVERLFLRNAALADVSTQLELLVGATVVRAAVAWALESGGRATSLVVAARLRRRLVAHLLEVRPRETPVGELAAAAVTGLDALGPYFARFLPQLVLSVAVPVVVFAWVVAHDPLSAVVMACTLPLIPIFGILVGKVTEARTLRRFRTLTVLSSYFLDVVRGLPTLRAFGRGGAQAERVGAISEAYRRETMSTLRIAFLSALVLELAATLSVAVIAVEIGLRLVDGGIALAPALAVLVLAPEFYGPLRSAAAQFHASADGLAAAQRVFALLDREPAVRRPAHPHRVPDLTTATIGLRSVTVQYPGRDEPALAALTAVLAPRAVVAVAGPSGIGKTTLLEILLRLREPSTGSVLVDDVDLADIDPDEWQRHVAWVPQRPRLAAGTVRDALRAGAAATDEQLLRALELAGAAYIAPLDQMLGERTPLSAGEIRRLALARALVRDPLLLVLDEPTTHLDANSAELIVLAIASLDCRVVVATHDERVLAVADEILDLARLRRRVAA